MCRCSRPNRDLRDDGQFPWGVLWWALCLIGFLAAVLLTGCATAEAIAAAPEGYWTHTWLIVEALGKDILGILAWFLPI